MIWRWDQGRLDYFLFQNIRDIAKTLYNLNNVPLERPDLLRPAFQKTTSLPFLPQNYTVWRNYKRVFGCSLLATSINNRLVITDIVRLIAEEGITADDYFAILIPRFYFPSPIFQDFRPTDERSFPFCAILRYLLSQPEKKRASLTVDEVFSILIANKATGLELKDFYSRLAPKSIHVTPDQKRQVRELIIFISQFSPLKWIDRRLILDIAPNDYQTREALFQLATPIIRSQEADRGAELLRLSTVTDDRRFLIEQPELPEIDETLRFKEGRRMMVYHRRIERSPNLRRLFMRSPYARPECDMCSENLKIKYPWTEGLFEIHHVLPLSSPLWLTSEGVSLNDIRGICPNCHRSVHKFYSIYLTDKERSDFWGREESSHVYEEAKLQVKHYGPT